MGSPVISFIIIISKSKVTAPHRTASYRIPMQRTCLFCCELGRFSNGWMGKWVLFLVCEEAGREGMMGIGIGRGGEV